MIDLKAQVEAAVMARGGKKRGAEIRFKCPCPSHDDAHNSADYNPTKHVWICRSCGESGNYWQLGILLGVINNGQRPDGFRETRRWDIGGVATHRRFDRDGAKKIVEWELQGKAGLDGLPTADLPLYTADSPADVDTADILLSEGEKPTDALLALGFAAAGTVTGAASIPSVESLKPLAEHEGRVFLCRDNDQPGHRHMTRIAARLKRMGKVPHVLDWPGVPGKGDAYDYISAGYTAEDVQAVLDAAPLYDGEAEPEPERKIRAIAASVSRYEPEPDTTEGGYHLTDAGNAEYFTDLYGDRLRYDHQRGRWLEWGSHHWREDTDGQVMRLALTATRRRYREAVSITDLEYREKVAKWTIGSEQRARLEACIAIAKNLKPIADAGKSWDGDGFLFCVKNGVVDLKTGELRDGQPEDMITRQASVNYDPGARAPTWGAFLEVITGGNADLATYMQRAIGYSLTGTNKNQVFFFAYGLGNNGKSTFSNTIRRVMGDYSHKLDIDDLMVKDKRTGSGPKEGLADLQGKRFVLAGEIQDGRRLDVGLVKDMTGGETIRARRLYEHGLEYLPSHKLWLMGNHKPVIADTTLSIWRRVKLIPFTVTIPDQDIDIDFPLRLEPELPGILAWAVQGCQDWQRYGLAEPAVITAATATYRHDSDILGDFIDDCCVLQALATVAKSDLKAEYHKWAEDTGIEPVTQRTFKDRLIEKGIIEGRSSDHKTRIWRGIRLRTAQDISDKTDTAFIANRTRDTLFAVKSPHERENLETLRKKGLEMSEMSENTAELPDCPACGRNEWVCLPSGEFQCPCGHPLKGGEQ